jgi:hypothetical protein
MRPGHPDEDLDTKRRWPQLRGPELKTRTRANDNREPMNKGKCSRLNPANTPLYRVLFGNPQGKLSTELGRGRGADDDKCDFSQTFELGPSL